MSVVLGPLSDDDSYLVPGTVDNPYFWDGGVSIRASRGDTIWQSSNEEQPEPWICHYCGSTNPPDTWHCTHCPAPRSEATREEESTWLPPTRVVSHDEKPYSELPLSPFSPSKPPSKPAIPVWLALITIGLFLLSMLTGLSFFVSVFVESGPTLLSITLAGAFYLLFYAFSRLRKVIRKRYDWKARG